MQQQTFILWSLRTNHLRVVRHQPQQTNFQMSTCRHKDPSSAYTGHEDFTLEPL